MALLNDKSCNTCIKSGIFCSDGFPEYFRAFVNGELSASVERYGGLNSIEWLDIQSYNGKLYPDRHPIPIFARVNQQTGNAFYSPAIRWFTESQAGRFIPHEPQSVELFPFGFRSTQTRDGFCAEYDLLLLRNCLSIAFRSSDSQKKQFHVGISRRHLQSGKLSSMKSQFASQMQTWKFLTAKQSIPSVLADETFYLLWRELVFDHASNAFVMKADLTYPTHSRSFYVVFRASVPLQFEESMEFWTFKAEWAQANELCFALGLGNSKETALAIANDGIINKDKYWQQEIQCWTKAIRQAPLITVSDLPYAKEFTRVVPGYQRFLLLAESDSEAAIRAAALKYGYFSLWDHLYPIRDFITGNDSKTAKKLITYLLDYPAIEYWVWATSQLLLTIDEYLAFNFDEEFRKRIWPTCRKFFLVALEMTHPEFGLVKTTLSAGADHPEELNLGNEFFASCINGWFYGACRVWENLALEEGDDIIAELAASQIQKIEKSYLPVFFDIEQGYLKTAVSCDGVSQERVCFQNTNTLALDYVYGNFLLREKIGSLARYQSNRLYHPLGYASVAYDSQIPGEMWRSVHMNQHLGHEAKLARRAGNAREAVRLVQRYLEQFHRCKNAIETFNLAGCDGDAHQTADWQAFSATAERNAILQGVGGIGWHQGGLYYLPAADSRSFELSNFQFRNKTYEIIINGNGAFVEHFDLNGVAIEGTMQIPADIITSPTINWHIVRSETPFDRPILLEATNLPLIQLKSTSQSLCFTAGKHVHAPVVIFSTRIPKVSINGQYINFEYQEEHSLLWLDYFFSKGDIVVIQC